MTLITVQVSAITQTLFVFQWSNTDFWKQEHKEFEE